MATKYLTFRRFTFPTTSKIWFMKYSKTLSGQPLINFLKYDFIFRATVEYNTNKPTMPPVEIIISKGDQNIAIKISDRGGGASLEQQQKWEAYLFSSGDAAPAENLNNPISVPMAGYGYGIPLTKVMARYLGGDIEIRSIEDYGTDVYIYLQNCPETCFEGYFTPKKAKSSLDDTFRMLDAFGC